MINGETAQWSYKNKMNIKENYLCLYTAGLSGTWLAWFINQHASFPRYNRIHLSNRNAVTDLECNGATWCFTADTENGAQDKPMTFDEYLEHWAEPESNNAGATKNCCKILPDHDLTWDHDQETLHNVLRPFSKIVVPYLPPESPFINLYAWRNKVMWDELFDDNNIENFRLMIQNVRSDIRRGHYDKFGSRARVHYVNLHDLLMLEMREYERLAEFLEEPELEGWEGLVNDYRTRFIAKNWEKVYNDSLPQTEE